MKEEEMRGIIEKCGEVKRLKLTFHPNNTRTEVIIFSPVKKKHDRLQKNLTPTKDGEQNCTNQSGNHQNLRDTKKPDNRNKEHEQRKNNESSTK